MNRLLRFCCLLFSLILAAAEMQAQPDADFTASVTSGCKGTTVYFTDISTGSPTGWYWILGNGNTSFSQNPQATYNNAGTYTVTLVAANASGADTITKTAYITIYADPVVNFSGTPVTGCEPLTVNFTQNVTPNSPGTPSYDWDFGDGSAHSYAANPSHVFSAGIWDITLSATSYAGCQGSLTKKTYITTYAKPQVAIYADTLDFCHGNATAHFSYIASGVGPFNVSWNFGDPSSGGSNTSTSASPVHTYASAGSYTVTMNITDNGTTCTNTAIPITITVNTTNPTFTGPNAACENASNTFTNTTPGASSVNWNFGDGITGTGSPISHTYTAAGTYQITMSTVIGNCTKTLVKSISIKPNPTPTITFSPDIPCPAPSVVLFKATTPNVTSAQYTWDFGSGPLVGPNVKDTQSHTFTSNGYKTVSVSVVNSITGCTGTATLQDVPINGLTAEIEAAPEKGCVPLSSTFSVKLYGTLPPGPPGAPPPPYPVNDTSWYWTFNDVTTPPLHSILQNPSYTWNTIGTYIVTDTGYTQNGCIYRATKAVHVDTKVPPNFSATPLVVCPRDLVTFTNLTTNTPNTNYTWSLGDTTFSTTTWTTGFKHGYHRAKQYDVKLTTDHQGCIDTLTKANYITVHPSNADFDFVLDCTSYKVTFTDKSDSPSSWSWAFDDGTFDNTQNPVHTYASPGTYYVRLATYNNTYGCRDTMIQKVIVFSPGATIAADKTKACVDDQINFTGGFLGAGSATYSWVFDSNPPTPFSANPFYTYSFNTRGFHNVKLIISYGNGCQTSKYIPNYILAAQPTVNFTGTPLIGCAPLNVSFTDASTAVSTTSIIYREWDFGDGSMNTGNNTSVSRNYPLPGNYTIKLKAQDDIGCQDSLIRINYVSVRMPVADFTTPNSTVCVNTPVTFTNTSSGVTPLSYTWNFGDGSFSNTKNPTHTYTTPGTYTVSLTAKDNTPCQQTKTFIINVVGPNAGFTMDKTFAICPPLVVSFTNTTTNATSYSWDMGKGGTPLTVFQPAGEVYPTPGKYDIVLTAKDANGCWDTAQGHVYVLGYNGGFSYTPKDGCLPQTVSLTPPATSIPQITWDFGDGAVVVSTTSSTVTHTYTATGSYYPRAIYSDGLNCRAFDSAITPIRVDKVSADFTTSVPCIGVPFTLSSSATAVFNPPTSFLWRFGGTDSAVGTNASYLFTTSGNHPVKLIAVNSWGCKDSVTKDVLIHPLPLIDAGPSDTGICPGDTILLVGHGGQSYTWGPAGLVSCTLCNPTKAWTAAPTTYYLSGTDSNGCVNIDSITARIQIKTSTNVLPGGEICIGESFRLHASGASIYHWQPVAFLDSSEIPSPLATPIITTTYVVESQEGTCLVRYDSVTVVVHPLPIFDAGPDEFINYGSAVMLHPTKTGIARIEWLPDSTLSCTDCFDPWAHPSYTTRYFAKAYSEYGCVDSDSVYVRVRCNGDSVFIPNTFTPNGDGLNDFFYPRGKGIDHMTSLRIFNRWGELVFERYNFPLNDEKSGWDGSFKGKQLPPDVYMYTFSSRCPTGEPVEWKGDITLIR
jgi:gliding motility-associated-like protein